MTASFVMSLRQLRERLASSAAAQWLGARRNLAIPLALAGALTLAFQLGRHTDRPAAPTAAPADAAPKAAGGIPLSDQQLQRAGLQTVRPDLSSSSERPISGFVEAAVGARSTVSMPVAGRIVRLLVAPGNRVRPGSPIAEVQSPDAAVVRAEAEAAHATAQSLNQQYRRAAPMAYQGALAWQELETRRIASVKATTDARAAHAKAQALGSPDPTGRLLIRSPMGGQVAAVPAVAGSFLAAGAEVAEISDAQGSELRLMVSPLLGANLQPGQSLRVKAGPRDLRARILAVAPDAGNANRVMVVRAMAMDGDLPPAGTAVTAFVMVPSSERRFSVTESAVQIVNGSPVVFRYQRGVAQPVQVVLGARSMGRVEILQGLRGNELLLSGNVAALRSSVENKRF